MGVLIRPDRSRRRFYTPPALQLRFSWRAPLPASGGERRSLSQGAGAGMAEPGANTAPRAGFFKSLYSSPVPECPRPLSGQPPHPRHKLLRDCALGLNMPCAGPRAPVPTGSQSLGGEANPRGRLA